MKKLALALSLAVSTLLPLAQTAHAAGTVRISSMEGFAPFNYTNEAGTYVGLDTAVVDAVFEALGVSVEHAPRPWKRALAEFEHGDTDVLFQFKHNDTRDAKWHIVRLRSNNQAYFVTAGSDVQDITSLEDLSGLTVGVMAGFSYNDAFDAASNFKKAAAPSLEANIKKLKAGRVDVVIANEAVFDHTARTLGLSDAFRTMPTPATKGARYIGFQKTPEGIALGDKFKAKLEEMQSSGAVDDIVANAS
ncbi:putative amino-acid ABC transporter-binding protein precursor [Tritonibacter multivorans]|uniref:Putative amino-acid ABC transporter-binding protein n=1 Tax=Tritonibacter multivorans TaxID=928856 RepID=A0A0P1G6W1_9RHOB|nr:transporter substrate-binding domain-containing protein [Tritonibacter multivorans]MDA7421236.1 transporter substrate-binding domain-containing protein [Tritonibacter multivorans]CUH77447.1 putative amino-acid ABC transporter-binding protein precursor [Tritonibacter multivorans]SFD32224.1 amino acid ABC transporter substrate-binding protein, PAAT family [Tritonibacter multivorans]